MARTHSHPHHPSSSLYASLLIAGLTCLIRPSAVLNYLTPSLYLFLASSHKLAILARLLPTALLVVVLGFLLDSHFYHAPTLTWLNFARINYFQSISSFYGISQWHYYVVVAIPAIALTTLPLSLHGLLKHRFLLITSLGMIVLNTLSAHKEIRFLYPINSLLIICASKTLHGIRKGKRAIIAFLVATNLAMFCIFGLLNQRGSIAIMRVLREHEPASVYFAMPCHSTPLQSHLHLPKASLRFVTCEPPISVSTGRLIHYQDETDVFSKDPVKFIRNANVTEEYVVVYDGLLQAHPRLFDSRGAHYAEVERVWNGPFATDERRRGDIVLLRRMHK